VNCGLRLDEENEYYRDGGAWSLNHNGEIGNLKCTGGYNMEHMVGKKLVPITYEEWSDSNGEYGYSIDYLVTMGYDRDKIMSCGKGTSLSSNKKYLLIG
jgi:hypothetical protein